MLKQGRPQKGWSSEAKCSGIGNGGGGCGALLLVEQDDLFETTSSARDETDYFTTFRCMSCGVLSDMKPRPPVENLPSQREWRKTHGL